VPHGFGSRSGSGEGASRTLDGALLVRQEGSRPGRPETTFYCSEFRRLFRRRFAGRFARSFASPFAPGFAQPALLEWRDLASGRRSGPIGFADISLSRRRRNMKSGTDRTDAWPILALLAGALLLAVIRLGASVSPDRLLGTAASIAPSLAPLALGAVAIALALASQRLITTRRTLRARRAVALLPADEFDPKPDAVLGFAARRRHPPLGPK
jgi:hypothetical protein